MVLILIFLLDLWCFAQGSYYNYGYPHLSNYGYPQLSNYGYPHLSNYGYPHLSNYGYPHLSNYGYPPLSNYGYPFSGYQQNYAGSSNGAKLLPLLMMMGKGKD